MTYLLLTGTFLSVVLTQLYYFCQIKKLEGKIETIIETKVEEVITSLLREIPMASTFLKGSFLDKIKFKAHEKVRDLIPQIKQKGGNLSMLFVPWIIAFIVSLMCIYAASLIL